MKKLNKVLIMTIFAVASIFLVYSFNIKADGPLVERIEGASIRTGKTQGLRYYAKLDESVKENQHYKNEREIKEIFQAK